MGLLFFWNIMLIKFMALSLLGEIMFWLFIISLWFTASCIFMTWFSRHNQDAEMIWLLLSVVFCAISFYFWGEAWPR